MADYTKIFMKFGSHFWPDEEWFVHAHAIRGYFPVFYNLEAEGLFPKGTNILVAFVVGNEARRIERQSIDETKAEITAVLRTLFGDTATAPTEIFHSGWSTNAFTYGAYSNWPVEVSEECFKKIQSRVGRIFFGGEHTDETYNGYIIGGQRSGEREAMKILGCMAAGDEVDCPIWTKKKTYCDCDSSKLQNVTIALSTIIVVLIALPIIILLWRRYHTTSP